jgi:hypothetical protein
LSIETELKREQTGNSEIPCNESWW